MGNSLKTGKFMALNVIFDTKQQKILVIIIKNVFFLHKAAGRGSRKKCLVFSHGSTGMGEQKRKKKGLLTQHPFCTQHAGYFLSGAEWKAQPPQEAQLPPHVPIPLLWSCTMVYTETRTNKRITSPTMSVPIRINSFALHCNSY